MKGILSSEERTIEFFKKKFGSIVNNEEARKINERVSTVFTLLAKWDREQNHSIKNSQEVTGDFYAS